MKINYKLLEKLNVDESVIYKFINTFGEIEIPKDVSKILIKGDSSEDVEWIIGKIKLKNCKISR